MRTRAMNALGKLHRDESGQDLVEYALVAVMIALGAAAAMDSVAASIRTLFAAIGSELTSA